MIHWNDRPGFKDFLLVTLIGIVSFFPFLGQNTLFDWDEINFAESAREMLVSRDFLEVTINFRPFYEKPPLFFWFQAACMSIFGVNEFSARLPNALSGIASLLFLFHLGAWLKDKLLGWLFIGFCLASFLPNLYFRTGIIDPFFNLLILLGLYFFLRYFLHASTPQNAALSGLFCGLAILAKGPVALLFYGLVIFLYLVRYQRSKYLPFLGIAFLTGIIPLLGWYGTLTWYKGWEFLIHFFYYQIELFTQPVAGHQQPWFYHPLVMLALAFPMSWLVIRAFRTTPVDYTLRKARFLFAALFISVLVIFSISTTKIVHYSSLSWLAGCVLCGILVRERMALPGKFRWKEWDYGLILTGVLPGMIFLILGWFLPNFPMETGLIGDRFILDALKGPVAWSGKETWAGGFLLFSSTALFIYGLKIGLHAHTFPWLMGLRVVSVILFLHLLSVYFVPSISDITQGPAVRFYQTQKGKNVVLLTEGYKSYAPYFYGETQPPDRPELQDKEWLLFGKIDRPVWMVIRTDRMNEDIRDLYRNYKFVYQSGGFLFFLRLP